MKSSFNILQIFVYSVSSMLLNWPLILRLRLNPSRATRYIMVDECNWISLEALSNNFYLRTPLGILARTLALIDIFLELKRVVSVDNLLFLKIIFTWIIQNLGRLLLLDLFTNVAMVDDLVKFEALVRYVWRPRTQSLLALLHVRLAHT